MKARVESLADKAIPAVFADQHWVVMMDFLARRTISGTYCASLLQKLLKDIKTDRHGILTKYVCLISVIIKGVPDNVDARDFINTLLSSNEFKELERLSPLSVDESGGYAVLLPSGIKGIAIRKLLFTKKCTFQGRVYQVSLEACAKESVPEDWLCDASDFKLITPGSNQNSGNTDVKTNAQSNSEADDITHLGKQSSNPSNRMSEQSLDGKPKEPPGRKHNTGLSPESSASPAHLQSSSDRHQSGISNQHGVPQQNINSPGGTQQHISSHNIEPNGGYHQLQQIPPYELSAQHRMPRLKTPQPKPDHSPYSQGYAHHQMPLPPQYSAAFQGGNINYNQNFPQPQYGMGMPQQGLQYQAQPSNWVMYGPQVVPPGFRQPFRPQEQVFSQNFWLPGSQQNPGWQQFQNVHSSLPATTQGDETTRQQYPDPDHVHRKPTAVQSSKTGSGSNVTDSKTSGVKDGGARVIEVTELPAHTTEDALTMYFENTRRSGGGDIEKVELDKKKNMACIYFQRSDVVERVLKQNSHLINKQQVHVSLHVKKSTRAVAVASSETSDDEQDVSSTIEVKGFKTGTSDDTFEMYFENTRRSGGENVTSIERNDDVIYVTFATRKEVRMVLEKKHEIDGKMLQVKLHVPKPCYKNRLLVSNLKNTTTKDSLLNYLEARSRCEVTDIVYGDQPGIALVTFDNKTIPDLDKLKQECRKRSLHDRTVEISKVPIADSIVVQGLTPNISEETVTYYFESKRSGNKDGSDVTVTIDKEGICFVQFEDCKVVDAVLSKRNHKIEGCVLTVSLYMECLGISPVEQSWYKQPEAFTMESLNKDKCRFLHHTKDQNLKEELAACFTEITWLSEDTATLKCTLTKETHDAVNKAKAWKTTAENCLTQYFNQIMFETVTSLSEIWDDVHSKLKTIIGTTTKATMFVSDSEPKVVLVGYDTELSKLAAEVKSVVRTVEEEYNKKKQEITETVKSLKPIQLSLLLALGFHSQMKKDYKDLNVVIRLKQNEMILKGQVKDVRHCKLNMYERMNSFCYKDDTGFSETQLEFLEHRKVKDMIVDKLKNRNLYGVWNTESRVLTVLSTSEEDALAVIALIRELVVEHTETLEPECGVPLKSEKWSRLLTEIKNSHGDLVMISSDYESNSIVVVAIQSIIHGIRVKIEEFISENSVYSRLLKIPKPVYRFLMMHGEKDITRTRERISDYNGKIECRDGTHQIFIKGRKEGLEQAVTELLGIAKGIVHKRYSMIRAGIGKYIHSEKIKGAISETEKSERCVIVLQYDKTESIKVEGGSLERHSVSTVNNRSVASGETHFASCIIKQGRRIDVVMGDMTTMKVDVIVNAANNRLDHIGGLARAIAVKGGPAIQRESDEYISKKGHLRAGDVVTTGPGRLPCKMVAHAVGPIWSGGNHSEKRDLMDAVMGSMECADRRGYKSIVLPTLSAGIFGYPIEQATKHIVEAIDNFYTLESPNSGLTNVYLVDVGLKSVHHFVAALQDVYHSKVKVTANKPSMPPQIPPKPKLGSRAKPALQDVYHSKVKVTANEPSMPPQIPPKPKLGSRAKHVFLNDEEKPLSQKSITITLIKGEIAKQNADVIVNSTSNNLDLTNGAVSKSVVKASGQSLQKELKKKYPNGIQSGEVAVSSGGKLQCREVYHTCLGSWSKGGNSAFHLKKVVHTCLSKASENGYSSIAFPALGTGNLGYPIDVVAQTMYTTVRDFQQRNGSLRDALFVVYHSDRDVIKAFEQCEKQMQAGESFEPPSYVSRQSKAFKTEEQEEENEDFTVPASSAMDSFKVDLVKGEIDKQKVDVIVNSTSNNLDLTNGAVAKSLLKTGGQTLQKELRDKYPNGISPGDIAVTSGGKLQCHEVYHTCLSSWSDRSNKQFLESVIQKCLQKASNYGYKSIAFPALGTGNLGYPREIVARTMFTAMKNFQLQNASLEKVQIVIYHKDTPTIQAFEQYDQQGTSGGNVSFPDVSIRRSQQLFSEDTESTEESSRLYIGCISIEIKQGDITQESADCIINSTNTGLDLRRGAVSSAIVKACGKDMESQCSKKAAEMGQNGIICTTASGLNCKYVIHVAGDHFGNNWNSVILACLNVAEGLGDVQSVAFPVLGTGVRHVNPTEIASIMGQALTHFETKAVNVNEVRVVVFQTTMLDPFARKIKQFASITDKTEKPAVTRKFVQSRVLESVSPGSADLYFFSDDMKYIENGIKKLNIRCENELTSKEVKDEVIKKMTDEQIDTLKKRFDVDLVVDRKTGIVKITGLAAEAGDAMVEVTTYLRNIEKEEGQAEKATLLSRSVQWCYFEKNSSTGKEDLKSFENITNLAIEKNFENKKDCKVKIHNAEWTIDFSSMKGTLKGKKDSLNIIRRDLFKEASASIFDPPTTWQPMNDDVNFICCDVPNSVQEYNEVTQLFLQTVGVATANVLKVTRIQNRALYQQYMAKKTQLEKQNPQVAENEKRLWHGTSTDAIDSINMHGYNRSYCGKNATAYGQGVYFAVHAQYSANNTYSRPDQNGHKYMYLAKVLTGVFAKGNPNMRVPPPKPGSSGTHDLCDSVVNDEGNPGMFIVFNDTQAYPEYLLKFTL